MTDDVLFRAGGCHVFALELRAQTKFPLILVHEDGGPYDHVACQKDGLIVDYFGWFSLDDYVRAEMNGHISLRVRPIEEKEVKSRYVFGNGPGYYAHPDFMLPATDRARAWIRKHQKLFDGTNRIAIPGVSRVQKASPDELDAIFDPKG